MSTRNRAPTASTGSPAPPTPPDNEYHVEARGAARWTLAWVLPAIVYAATPVVAGAYRHQTYVAVRLTAILLLVVVAAAGIVRAWKFIGGSKAAPAWYTDGFLVALVMFWAVVPPTWFFLEYYMFDSELIALPPGIEKNEYLQHTKMYADLASKIWAGVGATVGAAIAAARK